MTREESGREDIEATRKTYLPTPKLLAQQLQETDFLLLESTTELDMGLPSSSNCFRCGYYSGKKRSMKRRRPTSWASPSTIIAATALLTAHLWTPTAGIPLFLELEEANKLLLAANSN